MVDHTPCHFLMPTGKVLRRGCVTWVCQQLCIQTKQDPARSTAVSGPHPVLMYMCQWAGSSDAAKSPGNCSHQLHVRKGQANPIIQIMQWDPRLLDTYCHYHPRAAMTFAYFPWKFEVFWSCGCFITICLLPERCWITTVHRDFSQHASTWPTTFVIPRKLAREQKKGLVLCTIFYEITYSGKHPPIVLRDHVGLLRSPLGTATHPPSPQYSLWLSLISTLELMGCSHRAQQNPKFIL